MSTTQLVGTSKDCVNSSTVLPEARACHDAGCLATTQGRPLLRMLTWVPQTLTVHQLICYGRRLKLVAPSCPSGSYRWPGSTARSEAMPSQFPNDPNLRSPGGLTQIGVTFVGPLSTVGSRRLAHLAADRWGCQA